MRPAAVDLFGEVKERVSITSLLAFYGMQTRYNKTLCPFHRDGSPSLKIYPDNNSFYCFGCGVGGSVIDFTAKYYGISSLEAAIRLDGDARYATSRSWA